MANSRGGKHVKKPRFFLSDRTIAIIIATLLLTSLLTGIAFGIKKISDKIKEKNSTNDEHMEDFVPTENDIISIINHLKTINDSGQNNKSLDFIINCIENKISDPDLTDEEKIAILKSIVDNPEEFIVEVYSDIDSFYGTRTIIDVPENFTLNSDNLKTVTENPELMGYIETYSAQYGVPKEIIIGIVAQSTGNGHIDSTLYINKYWKEFKETRHVYDFTNNTKVKLNDYQKPTTEEEIIRFSCMVLADSLKESFKDLDKALIKYNLGVALNPDPENMKSAESFKTRVLLYAMGYLQDQIITVDYQYKSDINDIETHTASFESSQFKNELVEEVMSIVQQMRVEIIRIESNPKTLG